MGLTRPILHDKNTLGTTRVITNSNQQGNMTINNGAAGAMVFSAGLNGAGNFDVSCNQFDISCQQIGFFSGVTGGAAVAQYAAAAALTGAGAAAGTFTAGGAAGSANVASDSTFNGRVSTADTTVSATQYSLQDVVRALKLYGLLG